MLMKVYPATFDVVLWRATSEALYAFKEYLQLEECGDDDDDVWR